MLKTHARGKIKNLVGGGCGGLTIDICLKPLSTNLTQQTTDPSFLVQFASYRAFVIAEEACERRRKRLCLFFSPSALGASSFLNEQKGAGSQAANLFRPGGLARRLLAFSLGGGGLVVSYCRNTQNRSWTFSIIPFFVWQVMPDGGGKARVPLLLL